MKFAATDITFPKLDHPAVFKLLRLMDFDAISLGLFENRTHIYPSKFFSDRQLRQELSRMLQGEGLRLIDIFLQCDTDFKKYAINHPEKARRDYAMDSFNRLIDVALELNCDHVSILPGVVFDDDVESSLQSSTEQLAKRCEIAKKAGVTVAIEPHFGSVMETPEAALSAVSNVPDLRIVLDYAHFLRLGVDQSRVHKLCPYTSLVHARCANKNEQQTIFSLNEIKYPEVIRELKKTGFDGYLVLEFYWDEWDNGNRVDNVSETIILRDYLRKLIAEEN